MITVVSGYRRCGTSMMMQALNNGGIGIIHLPELDQLNPNVADYQPNPGGLCEVGSTQYTNAKFLRLMPDECGVKILFDGLPCLPKGDYKIIWMSRDLDEISISSQRVDDHIIKNGKASAINHPVTQMLTFCAYRPYDQDAMDHVLGICDARSDMEVIHVNYADVINDPLGVFEGLEHDGVPIDPVKAAAIVKPSLHRIRKNEYSKSRNAGSCAHSISNE